MKRNPSYGLKSFCFFLGISALGLMLTPRSGMAQSPGGIFDVRTLCSPLTVDGGSPEEEPCVKNELRDVAKRDGRMLTLKLSNGKTKVISDAKECDDPTQEGACVKNRLVGHIGDRQFIVHVQPYECGYVLLVNRRTGEETKLDGWPALSPNNKRFVVTASSVAGECGPEYGVAIFSLASDPPRLEWKFTSNNEYEDYYVDGWDGENRVRLRAPDGNGKQTATDLKLTAQGWQLKRSNGALSLGERVAPPAQIGHPTTPIAAPSR